MTTVYICTRGEYADYRICAVFDDKTLAEKFCATFECEIEAWNLNPITAIAPDGHLPYFVRTTRDGVIREAFVERWPTAFVYNQLYGFDVNGDMYFRCMAMSIEHAEQLASERRVNLITANQWGIAL